MAIKLPRYEKIDIYAPVWSGKTGYAVILSRPAQTTSGLITVALALGALVKRQRLRLIKWWWMWIISVEWCLPKAYFLMLGEVLEKVPQWIPELAWTHGIFQRTWLKSLKARVWRHPEARFLISWSCVGNHCCYAWQENAVNTNTKAATTSTALQGEAQFAAAAPFGKVT